MRRRPPNLLYVEDIRRRLLARFPDARSSHLKKLRLMELLERGIAAGVLTDAEVEATLPTRTHTVKAYLTTFIKDPTLLANIDKYVISASLIWAYGTRLLNLGAIHLLGGRPADEGPVERFDSSAISEPTQSVYDLLGRDSCKHVFIPGAWAIDGPRAKVPFDPLVAVLWRLFGTRLDHLTRAHGTAQKVTEFGFVPI